jgi:hypothetical protein
MNKISYTNKFKEINEIIRNIDSFEKYSLKKDKNISLKNQLFSKDIPSFELVNKILYTMINKDLNENLYFEFSRKIIMNKKIIEKMNQFIPELKKIYLKCKHKKYLENLNEKKVITIFRQILRPYDYNIISIEKYNNGEKYLLYIIEKRKNLGLKKIDSTINFD